MARRGRHGPTPDGLHHHLIRVIGGVEQGSRAAHLFSRNLRDALDVSEVNPKIQLTLLQEPEHFWYFSNGITLLCESYEPKGEGRVQARAGVGFRLKGASVVNGAQTVDAVARAMQRNPGTAGKGRVLVRIISQTVPRRLRGPGHRRRQHAEPGAGT